MKKRLKIKKIKNIKNIFKKKSSKNNVNTLSIDAVPLKLYSTGLYHSTTIKANKLKNGKYNWYRARVGSGNESFELITSTELNEYHPSIQDVNARIACQWIPNKDHPDNKNILPTSFAEYGPLIIDPNLIKMIKQLIKQSYPIIFHGLSSNKLEKSCLIINKDHLIYKINDQIQYKLNYLLTKDLQLSLNPKNPKKCKISWINEENNQLELFRMYCNTNLDRDALTIILHTILGDYLTYNLAGLHQDEMKIFYCVPTRPSQGDSLGKSPGLEGLSPLGGSAEQQRVQAEQLVQQQHNNRSSK